MVAFHFSFPLPPPLPPPPPPPPPPSRPPTSSRAMKLGKKSKDVDSFVDKLVAEGESKPLPLLLLLLFQPLPDLLVSSSCDLSPTQKCPAPPLPGCQRPPELLQVLVPSPGEPEDGVEGVQSLLSLPSFSLFPTPSFSLPSSSPSVHLKLAEQITVVAGRDGGLQTMEVLGMVTLKVTDGDCTRIQIAIDNQEDRGVQFQVSLPQDTTCGVC